MVSLALSYMGNLLKRNNLLIKFLISFKATFNQYFLTYSGNLVTSEKFLGYGIKCDTSEPDYPNVGNDLSNSFATDLHNLCKTLHILFTKSSALFIQYVFA